MVIGKGSPDTVLSENEVVEIIESGIPIKSYAGKRVLALTPDATRTCPLPMMVRAVNAIIGARSAALDFMVALGTHAPLSGEEILQLYGISDFQRSREFAKSQFLNHRWDRPETLQRIGMLAEHEVVKLSGGRMRETVPIDINRHLFEYDLVLVIGPVFPHEVVGFSGGAKYLFPGISGGEFLHFFHWLSAVITCAKTIGRKHTPARDVIHRALSRIELPVVCLAMVVSPENWLRGLYTGDVAAAWSAAADLSAELHIVKKEKPFRIVLGKAPEMYDELWVAGKVMYKLEQVVAQGGRLIIYGPHIGQVSRTWGPLIEKIGYHVRDYFLAQPERFKEIPRGVLAHSTHVRGGGTYENGVETPLVDVVLATGIPEETCRRINLGYINPAELDVTAYMNREEDGILFVDHAGEILYQLMETP
jgi:nickel-dependent lactate racemase